jgi:hypothetical protein
MSARKEAGMHCKTRDEWITAAIAKNIITQDEANKLHQAFVAKMSAINVDDFAADAF